MNSRIYKYFGIILMVLTFIVIIVGLFEHIKDILIFINVYGEFDRIFEVALKNILFSTTVFVLGFFPGLFYYRHGKDGRKPNKLVKSAFILMIIPLVVMLFIMLFIFLSCSLGWSCDGIGLGLLFLVFGVPSLIIYCVGIVMLIIYKSKKKEMLENTNDLPHSKLGR